MQTIPQTYTANPLQQCGWFDFKVMHDARGNLSVIENLKHIPFNIERIYYLYDIPALAERAGHAHRNLVQVFISMSGSFDLHLDDGIEKRTVHLCRANRGYLVQPWTWRTLDTSRATRSVSYWLTVFTMRPTRSAATTSSSVSRNSERGSASEADCSL
jgi:hypothetical protein